MDFLYISSYRVVHIYGTGTSLGFSAALFALMDKKEAFWLAGKEILGRLEKRKISLFLLCLVLAYRLFLFTPISVHSPFFSPGMTGSRLIAKDGQSRAHLVSFTVNNTLYI
ncbi:hypothetical protein B0H66DRAFT_563457 [Apodospora peruviana]|uniref:Uncharacterized protein n=1 Tax=Apodospora peruviana TaxID=516989 RepID=A0AAE0M0M0_9PEZI|nr:hypothetical protein B0H66DRAFT_563457 [Apodospora peruviana]